MAQTNIPSQKHCWPSMRANQHNTGCSMHDLELRKNAVIRYYATDNAIFSTPIIDAQERIFIGSADKKFYAIDPIQNAILWTFGANGVIDSAGCLDNEGNIYVPSGDASIYKLNSLGKKQWEFNLLEKKFLRISTIYWWEANVVIGPNGLLYAGNDDFHLYAVTPGGHMRWSFSTGLQIWSAPAFNKGMVYITSFDMCVYALDQVTGRLKWRRRLQNVITSSPAIDHEGNMYVASFDGSIVKLHGATGNILWRTKTDKSIYASVAIAPDGNIFIGSQDGFVYCLQSKSGTIVWTLPVNSPIWSSVVIGQDPEKKEAYLAYVGTSGGLLIAMTPMGYRRWTYQIKNTLSVRRAGVNASPALGKSGLAVATTIGNIVYIPYDAYLQQPQEFSDFDEKNREEKITAPDIDINEGASFSIEKMEFATPEIITPFDQIGIASLSIEVGIIKTDFDSGRFIAFGMQTMGVADALNNYQGTPYPRRHIFAFNGIKKENSFTLEAKNCDFDITAFPVPLDSLLFEYSVAKGYSFRAILNCRHLPIKIFKKYGWRIVKHVIKNAYVYIAKLKIKADASLRFYSACWYMMTKKVWRSWGLINKEGYIDGRGTFFIKPKGNALPQITFKEVFFDKNKRQVVAKFSSPSFQEHKDFPGIMLIQKNPLEAVALDYGKQFHIMRQGNEITATLVIPGNIRVWSALEALVLINTKVQTSIQIS